MNNNWTVSAPLRIVCGKQKLFGPGIAQLLTGVQESGSIRQTAAQMGMSYSKAWNILRSCERDLAFALLDRQVGGANGGGATLTPAGQTMLARYIAFEDEAHAALHGLLHKHFGGNDT